MDFGTADKKCQLSSKVLFHFHELCRLRLRKTRGGDLPGLGGGGSSRGSARTLGDKAVGAPPAGAVCHVGVVLPDEGIRVCRR